jgi:hypothetical protein
MNLFGFQFSNINYLLGSSWKENISKKFAISYIPNKTINWTKLVYGMNDNHIFSFSLFKYS